MTDLSGKVAVVTGAGRGIGQGVAVRPGRLGASVVVNYSRDASGAAATVAEIESVGSRAIDVRADVSKPDEIEALLETARSRFGRLDIVVANAGPDEGLGPVLDVTEAEYHPVQTQIAPHRQPLSSPPFPAFGLDGMGAGVKRGTDIGEGLRYRHVPHRCAALVLPLPRRHGARGGGARLRLGAVHRVEHRTTTPANRGCVTQSSLGVTEGRPQPFNSGAGRPASA